MTYINIKYIFIFYLLLGSYLICVVLCHSYFLGWNYRKSFRIVLFWFKGFLAIFACHLTPFFCQLIWVFCQLTHVFCHLTLDFCHQLWFSVSWCVFFVSGFVFFLSFVCQLLSFDVTWLIFSCHLKSLDWYFLVTWKVIMAII